MRMLTLVAALLGALLGSVAALSAQVSAYPWTFQGNPGGSGAVVGETLQVTGADNGDTSTGHVSWMETTSAVPLHVTVGCTYWNGDDGEHDAPVYVLDGVEHEPDHFGYWPPGEYTFTFDVPAAHSFGFGVWTDDAVFGPGVATFHDLVVTPKTWDVLGGALDPRPWADVPLPDGKPARDLAGMSDVDGDGVRELLVGINDTGVRICSGATGATLLELDESGGFGVSVDDTGDMNADGVPDFVAGRPVFGGGWVEVHSGSDGALVFLVKFQEPGALMGLTVAGLGDVNGDGSPDIAAGAPQALGGRGSVLVFGGPSGQQLYRLDGTAPAGRFGSAIAALDDVDGDGVRDLAVAQPLADPAQVFVFSGRTGALLSVASESHLLNGFNSAVLASAGDFDGDGHGDVLWWHDPFVNGAKVSVRSGATGAEIVAWPQPTQFTGFVDVAGADFDGDGHPDAAFTVRVSDSPVMLARIYSGAPGHALLHEFQDSANHGGLLSAFGDVDHDGATDLAFAPLVTVGVGTVHEFHALDGKGVPQLAAVGTLEAHTPVKLMLLHGKSDAPVALFIGATLLELPFKDGTLVPQPSLLVPARTDADGRVTIAANWPAGIAGPFTFWAQAWIVDADGPQGFTASNAVSGSHF